MARGGIATMAFARAEYHVCAVRSSVSRTLMATECAFALNREAVALPCSRFRSPRLQVPSQVITSGQP
jgi:hypothetical protein